ncbi:hypothetical protein B0I35DRAFT_477164 [Stachybotrys elegans]|uniref:Uncharacterized protein n=1 Tax=Stachybotrys elegans TaxID=80388 RepID=A0A8K0WRU5_9HYPO|nr:hypothetical protein B0I35DRAFT_477164 [Stachybotrys elegans]
MTPLWLAVIEENQTVVDCLLNFKGDILLESHKYSGLDAAIRHGKMPIFLSIFDKTSTSTRHEFFPLFLYTARSRKQPDFARFLNDVQSYDIAGDPTNRLIASTLHAGMPPFRIPEDIGSYYNLRGSGSLQQHIGLMSRGLGFQMMINFEDQRVQIGVYTGPGEFVLLAAGLHAHTSLNSLFQVVGPEENDEEKLPVKVLRAGVDSERTVWFRFSLRGGLSEANNRPWQELEDHEWRQSQDKNDHDQKPPVLRYDLFALSAPQALPEGSGSEAARIAIGDRLARLHIRNPAQSSVIDFRLGVLSSNLSLHILITVMLIVLRHQHGSPEFKMRELLGIEEAA